MTWTKKWVTIPQYEHTSTNQHGCRYKKLFTEKRLCVAVLSAEIDSSRDLRELILLSHHLDTPVRYDFESEPQKAYIELVSKEQLLKK